MPHNVLVVDDSPDIHDLVRVGLIGEAIELRSCFDGRAALAEALRFTPDLILLDVDMPGTDGFEVCRRLKADPALAAAPVVFLTGASSADEKLQGLELGAIDYVTKPFDLVELRARVRAALRTKDLMDRLAREADHLRAHAEVLRLVAQNAPLEQIQTRLIALAESDHVAHAGGADTAAAIVLLREGHLRLTAPSLAPPLRAAFDEHLIRVTAALCSQLASRGETYATCDPTEDERWGDVRSAARATGTRACSYALIRGGGGADVLGAFCLFEREPVSARADADARAAHALLDQLAALLSIAVDHRQLTDQLEHRAEHDTLTGLPNRALFDRRLHAAIAHATLSGRTVGVLFIDVDRFKTINDTFGHLVGDLLLCQLVERLGRAAAAATTAATSVPVTVARLGGDEFAIVLPELADRADAVNLGHRIVDDLKAPFLIGGRDVVATVSLGLSCFPHDGRDTVTLQKNADTAMYGAKRGGRNALQCFDGGGALEAA